jgi:diadenosine tetraphosphate (Ap4A) HIT family hydrolase
MLYTEFLKVNINCPFCEPRNIKGIIDENEHAFMTYAIAPYNKHHILIIPNRHISFFEEINEEETIAIDKLLRIGIKMIRALGYDNYTILLRNGDQNNKSIEHLHYHIVPNVFIATINHDNSTRKIMSEEEIIQILEEFENLKKKEDYLN